MISIRKFLFCALMGLGTAILPGVSEAATVTLHWTAPGDDGTAGTAAQYDVRHSTSNITVANYGSATQATGEPTPKAAGQAEQFVISNLAANTTYYFAVKTADEAANWSTEIGDTHDPYGAIVTASMYGCGEQIAAMRERRNKGPRVGCHLLVQLWRMVQDREHTRFTRVTV
jgi:hypothetical protein